MAILRVDVEWRIGSTGMGGTYTFFPRPSITRPVSGQKLVEIKVPLLVGSVTQQLNFDSTHITLKGTLIQQDGNFDALDAQRIALRDGLDRSQPGQLHVISNLGHMNSKHIYYNGIVTKIDFQTLERSYLLDYSVDILLSNPSEIVV